MVYPAGVQTSTLTFSNPITFLGNEATRTELTVQPTAGVVWTATGMPIDDFAEVVNPGAGMPGSLTAPFVDQEGFTDGAGNAFTMWAYVVTRKTFFGSSSKTVKKAWAPVIGQSTVDFDNLPGGSVGLPVSAPPVPVTSVAGLAGVVGAESLAGELVEFLPDGVTPEVVDAALALKLDVDTAGTTYAAKSVETSKLDADQKGAVSGVAPLDAAQLVPQANLPEHLTVAAQNATYGPKWKTATDYVIGDPVILPNGDLKVSATNHTSGASAGTVNWADPPALATEVAGRSRNEARRRSALRRANGGTVSKVALPAGLGWTPPINIFKNGKTYTTDFDVALYKNAGGTTYYVDTVAGLDTNAGTTEALPVKTILKAYQLAASGSTIMILDRGMIYRAGSWSNQRILKSLNIIAKYPGEATVVYADSLAYSLTSGQTEVFEAARTNVNTVIDTTVWRHGYQYARLLSVAAVAAMPGSWYQAADGTGAVYVHTLNGLTPDNSKVVALLAGEAWYADSTDQAVSLYLEGFTILGGFTGNLMVNSVNNTIDVYGKNMTFNWATGAYSAVNIQGGRYAYFQGCVAVNSRKDGFNYTTNNLAVVLKDIPHFIEVNCEAYAHGLKNDIAGAENTNNASTGHLGALGVRIGGTYHDTTGGIIADVHTDTKTANYSSVAYDSVATDINFSQAWSAQQAGAEMWIFECQGFGSTSDLYALTGATLHADAVEYDTKNGGGTFNITNAL